MKKFNKITKAILLILCFALILPCAVSCADAKKKPSHTVNYEEDYYDDSSREKTKGNLPDDIDLDGETVGIFYSSFLELDVEGEDEGIDMVYSSIYERNLKVETWLNMEFSFMPSQSAVWNEIDKEITMLVDTDDDFLDIVMATSNTIIQQRLYPKFIDLNNAMYLDFEQPWWNLSAIKETSIDGRIYEFLYGDLLLSSITGCGAIFYNKTLYNNLYPTKGTDYLYSLVQSKEWTLDYFYYVSNQTYLDQNGNNERDDADIYAFQLFRYAEPIHYFANSSGVEYYKRNKAGFPEITINSTRSVEFCELLEKVIYQNKGANLFYPKKIGQEKGHENDFTDGRILFNLTTLGAALNENMREMQNDYGILPYPLWESSQEEYITLIANGAALVCVPTTKVKGNDFTRLDNIIAPTLEAMSIESYRSVTEKFYELALKSSYTRDDIAADMIDLIVSTSTKNFLYEYGSSLSGIGSIFSHCMENQAKFATRYASIGGAAKTMLDELIADYLLSFG